MAETSRWDTIRRRIAPLAFLLALVVLAGRTCESDHAEVRLSFRLGAAAADVRDLEVDVVRDGDVVATFHRVFGDGGARQAPGFSAGLDAGRYELRFDVATTRGRLAFTQGLDVSGAAEITVNVEPDLLAR